MFPRRYWNKKYTKHFLHHTSISVHSFSTDNMLDTVKMFWYFALLFFVKLIVSFHFLRNSWNKLRSAIHIFANTPTDGLKGLIFIWPISESRDASAHWQSLVNTRLHLGRYVFPFIITSMEENFDLMDQSNRSELVIMNFLSVSLL